MVLVPAYTSEAAIIIKEGHTLAPNMHWIGPAFAFNQKLIDTLGPEITEGLLAVDSVPNKDSATYAYFATEYMKRIGNDAYGNVYAAMTYDMVNMFALAIEKAGSTETKAIVQALHEISGSGGTAVDSFAKGRDALKKGMQIDYQGASGSLKFNKTNNRGVVFGVFEVKNGKPVLLKTIDEAV